MNSLLEDDCDECLNIWKNEEGEWKEKYKILPHLDERGRKHA